MELNFLLQNRYTKMTATYINIQLFFKLNERNAANEKDMSNILKKKERERGRILQRCAHREERGIEERPFPLISGYLNY